MYTTTPAYERTSPRVWPMRLIRFALALAFIVAGLFAGRYATFQLVNGNDHWSGNPPCIVSMTSKDGSAIAAFITEHSRFDSGAAYRYSADGSVYRLGDKTLRITEDAQGRYTAELGDYSSCGWTDSFRADWPDYLFGYIIGFGLLAIAIGLVCLLAYFASVIWYYLWNGRFPAREYTATECDNPECPCIEHTAPVFDHQKSAWNYHDCENDDCPCKDHS